MVQKSRTVLNTVPYSTNGVVSTQRTVYSATESMEDSSSTGSPRTDVDAVDRFLSDPTKKHDFHRALQESHKSAGDAGTRTFQVDRHRRTWTPADFTLIGNTGIVSKVEGFTMREPSLSSFPAVSEFSMPNEADRKKRGQEQYAAALPNRSQADLSSTLGEIVANPARALAIPGRALWNRSPVNGARGTVRTKLDNEFLIRRLRDRLRAHGSSSLEDLRAGADDYLAFIFGTRPTVQDLDDLAESISRSRSQAETVVRSSNRRLRRRVEPPAKSRVASRSETGQTLLMGTSTNTWGLYDAQVHWTTESSHRTWWSGAFRMSTKDTETWLAQSEAFFQRLDLISGIGFDAQTAWNLIPFSFLADWFANTGSFLENRQIIADYNIACEYGYTMNHTQTTRTCSARGVFHRFSTSPAVIATFGSAGGGLDFTYVKEVKRRDRCSSYGFYTDFNNLNPQQWGALTAIGLSNVPGVPPRVRL